jgi:hypothetical protein
LREAIDLADRIEAAAPGLMHLASRPETIGALVRAANASLDPAEVAQALVTHVTEWLPLSAWYVIAAEPDGVLKLLGKQIPEAGLKSAVESFADVIVQTGQSAVRVTNYVDDRVAGLARQAKSVEASTLGWPLVANGNVVGALVGLDRGRARRLRGCPRRFRRLARHLSSSRRPTRWQRPARRASRSPVGHRRPHAALQLTILNDALRKKRSAPCAAAGPCRCCSSIWTVQADQRRLRPPAGSRALSRGRRHH